MKTTTTISYGLVAGLAIASCAATERRIHEDHCANQTGNDWCLEKYGDGSRPYCSRGISGCEAEIELNSPDQDGCVVARPVDDACYSPCGGRASFDDDASCLDGAASSSGSGSSSGSTTDASTGTGESSSTGPEPCVGNEDCPNAGAPFCEPVTGECVACDGTDDPDGACAELDPLAPLCVSGACVQCTAAAPEACMGTTPVCDDASNNCVPCSEHDQCGEAACNFYTGACLPGDAVVHVGPGQTFATLTEAVASFGAGAEGTIVVHQADYNEAIIVDGGRVLAFLANAGDLPAWDSPSMSNLAQLSVLDGTVLMDGLELSGNGSSMVAGLRLDGGRAWVDRSRIVQNSGGGVLAEAGAELTLRNCFVGGADSSAALRVDDASSNVIYSTLGGGTINASGLACVAPDAVAVRNSIIVALGNEGTAGVDVDCPGGDITFTATETPFAGDGNAAVGELPLLSPEDWFVGYGVGNFHLQGLGLDLFDVVAEWRTGDPLTDIDGDPRPTVDGTPDYAGADLVP